ncbi:MAG: hypothetical protein MUC37_12580 [Hyphomicrobium sp.]|nr:hypothetical protein [Hyphomicrobium sp.]
MRPSAVDSMTPSMPDFAAPTIRIVQLPARRTTGLLLFSLLAVAALLLSPYFLIVTAALADQTVREVASARPLATAQILAGLAFWLILLGFPIYRLLDALTRSRSIEIAGGRVSVADRAFGKVSSWDAPLTEFLGVAPFLRATHSGVRHELILVHPERQRSLLIAMAPRLMQSDVNPVLAALGLSELPPRVLSRGGRGAER